MAKGKGKKTSLKTALSSQQSRLQKKSEVKRAAQTAQLKKKTKSVPQTAQRRPTIPFASTDKILLIGEGDFSFTRALVCYPPESLQFLPPGNVTATSYDSEEECYSKYTDAKEIVQVLRDKGVDLHFNIDATALHKHTSLKSRKWDRVVWNFPHTGRGITDQDRNILSNQVLIVDFLRSVSKILATGPVPAIHQKRKSKTEETDEDADMDSDDEGDETAKSNSGAKGTVLITLRNVPPYTLWNISKLAKQPPPPSSSGAPPNPGYIQLRSFVFHRSDWQGYEHRMTKGERAHGTGKTGEGGEDRTWEFCLRDS